MSDYFKLKRELESLFESQSVSETADIDWIMCYVSGKKRSMLPFCQFNEDETQKVKRLAALRAKHIPLAYILGECEFFGRKFSVSNKTLIPRQDTEVVVQKAIEEVLAKQKDKESVRVLDIGTGSGAIAITIFKETGAEVVASDVSDEALTVAKKNAKNLDADVKFFKSDLFAGFAGEKFDVIVSNPPYIETEVIASLEDEVKLNEPILALDGGADGLDFYRKIAEDVKNYLTGGGVLVLEIGYNQAEAVKNLLKEKFESVEVIKDFGGNDRVIVAK